MKIVLTTLTAMALSSSAMADDCQEIPRACATVYHPATCTVKTTPEPLVDKSGYTVAPTVSLEVAGSNECFAATDLEYYACVKGIDLEENEITCKADEE